MQHNLLGETVGSSDSTLLRFICLLGFFPWGFFLYFFYLSGVFFSVFVVELLLFLSGNHEFSHLCTAAKGRKACEAAGTVSSYVTASQGQVFPPHSHLQGS